VRQAPGSFEETVRPYVYLLALSEKGVSVIECFETDGGVNIRFDRLI
jgi:hypothetical protein